MVSFFSIYATVLMPPAFLMLILLTAPLPGVVERAVRPLVIRFTKFVFFHPVGLLHGRTIFDVLFSISVFVLATTTMAWQTAADRHEKSRDTSNRSHSLMKKWRAERNFWICVCGVTLYWCLHRFTKLAARVESLENEVDRKKKR